MTCRVPLPADVPATLSFWLRDFFEISPPWMSSTSVILAELHDIRRVIDELLSAAGRSNMTEHNSRLRAFRASGFAADHQRLERLPSRVVAPRMPPAWQRS